MHAIRSCQEVRGRVLPCESKSGVETTRKHEWLLLSWESAGSHSGSPNRRAQFMKIWLTGSLLVHFSWHVRSLRYLAFFHPILYH